MCRFSRLHARFLFEYLALHNAHMQHQSKPFPPPPPFPPTTTTDWCCVRAGNVLIDSAFRAKVRWFWLLLGVS